LKDAQSVYANQYSTSLQVWNGDELIYSGTKIFQVFVEIEKTRTLLTGGRVPAAAGPWSRLLADNY